MPIEDNSNVEEIPADEDHVVIGRDSRFERGCDADGTGRRHVGGDEQGSDAQQAANRCRRTAVTVGGEPRTYQDRERRQQLCTHAKLFA